MRLHAATSILLTAALATSACEPANEHAARAALLQNQFFADNQDQILREPALVAGKYEQMGASLYAYFRGSNSLFLYDHTRPDADARWTTRHGSAAAALIQLIGDPHPENIGAFRAPSRELIVDFDDFDAAGYGPYYFDVRRLALGFALVAASAGRPPAEQEEVARQVATGYLDGLAGLGAGRRVGYLRRGETGQSAVFEDLLKEAAKDGDRQKDLGKYTEIIEGARRLKTTDNLRPLSRTEMQNVARLAAAYRHTLMEPDAIPASATALKGAARRFGSGVSSYALYRYYLLFEGPTAEPGDDLLVELRECREPPKYATRLLLPARRFASNGERVITLTRRAQESALNDVMAGWADLGPHSFRARNRNGFQTELDVARIVGRLRDGRFSPADLERAAHAAGELLARTHARPQTADHAAALPAIEAAIGSDRAGFVTETTAAAIAYLAQVSEDHRLFQILLTEEGPLLGARLR